MASFQEWLQEQAGTLVDRWSAREFSYQTGPDVQGQMRLGQLGDNGYYLEGQAGVASQAPAGMSKETMLMVGLGVGALVLILALKD